MKVNENDIKETDKSRKKQEKQLQEKKENGYKMYSSRINMYTDATSLLKHIHRYMDTV